MTYGPKCPKCGKIARTENGGIAIQTTNDTMTEICECKCEDCAKVWWKPCEGCIWFVRKDHYQKKEDSRRD